jgi:hypothetical protein
MKELILGFHTWMLKHDTVDNAEQYFHYSDNDMLEEYLKEVSTQDTPAICTYSGLRSISGYTKEEEGTEEYKAYRRGWIDGYDEGLYDKNIK